ncbi:MAG TPA: lipoprotein [Candidatus Berkiella sp.]|nr:lipoprotein [Candidatus Berkiella sp.]
MNARLAYPLFLLSCLCLLCSGCGQTGPLYIPQPEKNQYNELL